MAEGVWKGDYPKVFGRSRQLSLNKFFDPSTPSLRKGCDGGEKKKGGEREKKKIMMTARTPTDWNAARSCQKMIPLYFIQ